MVADAAPEVDAPPTMPAWPVRVAPTDAPNAPAAPEEPIALPGPVSDDPLPTGPAAVLPGPPSPSPLPSAPPAVVPTPATVEPQALVRQSAAAWTAIRRHFFVMPRCSRPAGPRRAATPAATCRGEGRRPRPPGRARRW